MMRERFKDNIIDLWFSLADDMCYLLAFSNEYFIFLLSLQQALLLFLSFFPMIYDDHTPSRGVDLIVTLSSAELWLGIVQDFDNLEFKISQFWWILIGIGIINISYLFI